MAQQLMLDDREFPYLIVIDEYTGEPIVYESSDLTADAIEVWVKDILQGKISGRDLIKDKWEPGEVLDPELANIFKNSGVRLINSKQELADMLAYEGKDIVIFGYSSNMNTVYDKDGTDLHQALISAYAKVATLVLKAAGTKKIEFVAYDVNLLGLTRFVN